MKNLKVNYSGKDFNSRQIHMLVSAIAKEKDFRINYLEISFTDSEGIHQINREHLNHDYSTDIVTFNYSGKNDVVDAELIISTEDALKNAQKYKVDFKEEIVRLVIHGILHLLGYDDLTKKEKNIMKREENRLLNTFKFILLQKDVN